MSSYNPFLTRSFNFIHSLTIVSTITAHSPDGGKIQDEHNEVSNVRRYITAMLLNSSKLCQTLNRRSRRGRGYHRAKQEPRNANENPMVRYAVLAQNGRIRHRLDYWQGLISGQSSELDRGETLKAGARDYGTEINIKEQRAGCPGLQLSH